MYHARFLVYKLLSWLVSSIGYPCSECFPHYPYSRAQGEKGGGGKEQMDFIDKEEGQNKLSCDRNIIVKECQ